MIAKTQNEDIIQKMEEELRLQKKYQSTFISELMRMSIE